MVALRFAAPPLLPEPSASFDNGVSSSQGSGELGLERPNLSRASAETEVRVSIAD